MASQPGRGKYYFLFAVGVAFVAAARALIYYPGYGVSYSPEPMGEKVLRELGTLILCLIGSSILYISTTGIVSPASVASKITLRTSWKFRKGKRR